MPVTDAEVEAGHTIILATWSAENRGDGFYVMERMPGIGGHTEYGPMPEALVGPLIAELGSVSV